MRLWHKELIDVLPRQQLVSQWRECCLIAKELSEKGTPNHLLVNKVVNYPIDHFIEYCCTVADEMENRRYRVNRELIFQYFDIKDFEAIEEDELFEGWHNPRYFIQCYYNLQEKYDCGGITKEEWKLIKDKYEEIIEARY